MAKLSSPITVADLLNDFDEINIAERRHDISFNFIYDYDVDLVSTTLANGGLSTVAAGSMSLALESSTATNGSSIFQSKNRIIFQPGRRGYMGFTAAFTAGQVGSIQKAMLGDAKEGYGLGYSGTSFGVFRFKNSNTTPDGEFINQTAWNVNKVDGTDPNISNFLLDPTKYNKYKITLILSGGVVTVSFFIFTGEEYTLVHTLQYYNLNILVPTKHTNFPCRFETTKTSGSNNQIIYVSEIFAGLDISRSTNDQNPADRSFSHEVSSTIAGTGAMKLMLAIRSKATFKGADNVIIAKPVFVHGFTEGASPQTVFILRNPTITGSPTFVDRDASRSMMEINTVQSLDITANGTVLGQLLISNDSVVPLTKDSFNWDIYPGDIIAFAMDPASNTSVHSAFNWKERF